MKKITFFLILAFTFSCCIDEDSHQKKLKLVSVSNIPIKTTNQAVSEGFIDDNEYLYSFGGLDSTKLYSGIHRSSFRFDIKANRWEEIESLPDTLGKIANAASRIKDIIYIIGGYHVFADGSELSSNKVHRFDIRKNQFMKDGATIPISIDDHVQAIWRNELIYIITGWSNDKNVPDVQIYDPKQNRWSKGTSVPDNNIYKGFGASGTIINDTIYYFGGASMKKGFPIQNYLRKGIINPNNPTEIDWSYQILDTTMNGYRMAALNLDAIPIWIGGSSNTYNYNAIAYDKSGGVSPNYRILNISDQKFYAFYNKNISMDLRGICIINDSIQYLIGGIKENQEVTDEVYKLEWKK